MISDILIGKDNELYKKDELFTKFGGHPMAAGCSLEKENLKAFRKKINELGRFILEKLF